jgi:hypothetical protein
MSEIFRNFLHAPDAAFGALGRKILLFVDNCATHSPDTSSLRNVKVVFYTPNCTSVVQPLDLGLIKCFKQVYGKQLVQRAVCLMDAGKKVQLKLDIDCFGMATSDEVHIPELLCEVWPRKEKSRSVRHDGGRHKW